MPSSTEQVGTKGRFSFYIEGRVEERFFRTCTLIALLRSALPTFGMISANLCAARNLSRSRTSYTACAGNEKK